MHITIAMPHLIPPPQPGDAAWRALNAPHLKTLLARADYLRSPETDAAATLCAPFGVARQQDLPLAPLLARHAGLPAENGYWLCATPVHLETRRNALVLADPAMLDVTASEAALMVTTLARHLLDESITLHAPQPGQWFLRSDTTPAMTTSDLDVVTGGDVRTYLPQGADSARWHRILTEIQMLLHDHPVNEAREANGRLPINSVWLWAGGTLPARGRTPFTQVWSSDAVTEALARHTECRCAPAPARIQPDALEEGSHFFSTALLSRARRQGDLQAWSAAVTAFDRDWFQPLLVALKLHRLSSLTLIVSADTATHQFRIMPPDLLKFWRRNKYLQ